MSLFSILSRIGKKATDGVVGVTSGTTPVRTLDNRTKAFQFILVIGIVAFGLSGWLLYNDIVGATKLVRTTNTETGNTNSAIAELARLKDIDTDGDTLSDYDELYNVHSSPYLYSSAGDGISDGQKLKDGLDPNCPKGTTCPGFRLLTSVVDQNGQLTPEFLRRSLQSAGVPQATLDETDDATLLKIYREVIGTTVSNTNSSVTNGNTNTGRTNTNSSGTVTNTNTSTTNGLTELEQLSSAEIRQLLIQNGVDAKTLESVDDATLKLIFQQAITSNQ